MGKKGVSSSQRRLSQSRGAYGHEPLPPASTLPAHASSVLDACTTMRDLGLPFSAALSSELRAFVASSDSGFIDAPQRDEAHLHHFLLWLLEARSQRGAPDDALVAHITPYQYEALLAEFCKRGKIQEKTLQALADAAYPENAADAAEALLSLKSSPLVIDNAWIPLKLLGRGSYKAVYLCCDKSDFQNVKVVYVFSPQNPRDANIDTARKQFHREAIVQRHFRETDIKGLPYAESINEQPLYYVSEYREGAEPLHKVLNRIRNSYATDSSAEKSAGDRESYQLFVQVIRSLAAAAESGVLHRDVKPANILVSPTEHGNLAWPIDWGIIEVDPGSAAHERLEMATLTELPPELMGGGGTWRYTHPKELGSFGEPQDASPVEFLSFAMAVTLHEWLTLKTPYQDNADTRPKLVKAYAEAGAERAGLPNLPNDLQQGADGRRCAALYCVLQDFAAGAHGGDRDTALEHLLHACERIDTVAAQSTADRYKDYRNSVQKGRVFKSFIAALVVSVAAILDKPSFQQDGIATHEAGDAPLKEPAWKAWHPVKGDLSSLVQSDTEQVDQRLPGTYPVSAEVSGFFRNARAEGLMRVVDTKPPEISVAAESISIHLDDEVLMPEASAQDAGAGSVPVRVGNAASLKSDIPTSGKPLAMDLVADDGRGNTGHREIAVHVSPFQPRTYVGVASPEGSVTAVRRWTSERRPPDAVRFSTIDGNALQFVGAGGDGYLNWAANTDPSSRFVTTTTGAAITRMPLLPEQVEAFRGHLRIPGHIRSTQGEKPKAQPGDERRHAIFLSCLASSSTPFDADQHWSSRDVVVYIPGVGAVALFCPDPDAGDFPSPDAGRWQLCQSDDEVRKLLSDRGISLGEMPGDVRKGGGRINDRGEGYEQIGLQQVLPPQEGAKAIQEIMRDLEHILTP